MTTREKITRCKAAIEEAKAWKKYYTTTEKNARLADEWERAVRKLSKELYTLQAEAARAREAGS
jgi:ATP-dependent helicase YprA (DUF1998 family)